MIKQLNSVGQLVDKLNAVQPPTKAPTDQRVSPGELNMLRCTINFVNNGTAAVNGVGAMCCQVTVGATTFYNVPWVGEWVPQPGPGMVLTQPPLMYVIGAPSALATRTAWFNAPLVSPFSNFGSGHMPAQYRLVGDRVELRGGLAVAGTVTLPQTIFTFPGGAVDFSPSAILTLTGWVGTSGAAAITVTAAGVVAYAGGNTTPGSVNLDGITYSVT